LERSMEEIKIIDFVSGFSRFDLWKKRKKKRKKITVGVIKEKKDVEIFISMFCEWLNI
jgi:hypothetical protein